MTEVLFLSSVQGFQESRTQEVAERLRRDRPDLTVTVLSPEESRPVLAKYKLRYGPAIVVDGRLEFVGIPRYRMLVERIETSIERSRAAPSAPEAVAAAAPAANPGKPAASGE